MHIVLSFERAQIMCANNMHDVTNEGPHCSPQDQSMSNFNGQKKKAEKCKLCVSDLSKSS